MRTLRLLNAVALLLLFTPFFQMCSDDDDKIALNAEASVESDSVSANVFETAAPEEDKPVLEAFWELITVPGDNFTTTAFGLLVITVFDVAEGHFGDIWFGSILTIASLVITTIGLIRLARGRTNGFPRLVLINLLILAATFCAALMTFDSVGQVKWGYYAYVAITAIIYAKARAVGHEPAAG